ncbi:MAG: LEA type 2 family protein [Gammaproteobacteria bacterium]|nr:LEA type 2 family protein [Gammaproteobacteria bacterium]MBU1723690.1 LEA type 2 family protein [Gammaproteobacteria bacterium]MBU2004774.1 LEA type 2 family protein [Gammaproteobacteria bacterium]
MLKRIFAFVFTALLLQACSGVPGIVEQPKVSIQNIGLQNISLTQGTAIVTLNVSNPNPFPLPIRGIEYGLSLNGHPVASGDQVQEQSIGAGQEVPVSIPIRLDFVELARLAPVAWRERKLQYDLTGAVRLPLIKVPFQRQGGVGVQQ